MCRLAKKKSNMADLSNSYPWRKIILKKVINHKTKIHFLKPQFTLGIIQIEVKMFLKGLSFGSKECIEEQKLEWASFLGQTSKFRSFRLSSFQCFV